MKRIRYSLLHMLLLLTCFCEAAQADRGNDKEPLKFTLHPASEPRPALKYRLLPKFKFR